MRLEEEYIHYQEAITCLNRAWVTICELENTKSGSAIWAAAYRMTLIEYCKPFKKSTGLTKKHQLTIPNFDSELKLIHEEIINLRDKVLAHSDLTVLDAKVYYGETHKPIISKNILKSMPAPSNIRKLIEYVLDDLYSKESEYISN
jgi:hypothetical protein